MTSDPLRWQLDHIAVFARTLDEGAAHVREQLGIDMPSGGAHPLMGTHNLLVRIGNDAYMEVIAVDPDAPAPARPRWFGLDDFDGEPRLGTWCVGTSDIAAALAEAHANSGDIVRASRGDLHWQVSIPSDGSMPMDGAFPMLIEWPDGAHPAGRMQDLGLRLRSLSIEHPEADALARRLRQRVDDGLAEFRPGPECRIYAHFDTPSGERTLS